MTKLKVSFDGRNNNTTCEITGQGQDGGGQFIEFKHRDSEIKAWFESAKEYQRFMNGVCLCRAYYQNGQEFEVYLSRFGK